MPQLENNYYLAPDDSTSTISIEDDEIWDPFNFPLYHDTIFASQGLDFPTVLAFTNGQFHTKTLVK